jgi:hypothetical protein
MAAGDDQKNVYLWKLNKNLPKLVRENQKKKIYRY